MRWATLDVPFPHIPLTKNGSSGSGFFTTNSNLPASRGFRIERHLKFGGIHDVKRHRPAVEVDDGFRICQNTCVAETYRNSSQL